MSIFPKFHKDWAKIVDFLLGHSDFKIAFLIKLRLYSGIRQKVLKIISIKQKSMEVNHGQPWKIIMVSPNSIEHNQG